ncbi:MAG: creatininase family protein [Chloroflexi bacterium]|nr:creatininase family protein [Chloroflexota bacterium]
MTNEIWMERMTWQEIQQAMDDGYDTVILIAGSIEQHGPALPLGTDTYLGYAMADGIARKIGKTLVAPVIRPGLSEHHMHFKGTLTLTKETFKAVVRDVINSLVRHGFKRIAVTYSHGGNEAALDEVLPELARTYPDVDILTLIDEDAFSDPVQDIIRRDGITSEQMGVHAGEMETSMLLAWDETLVRKDKFEQGFMGDFGHDNPQMVRALSEGLHTVTNNGILGDSRKASKSRGQDYNDAVCGFAAKHFKKVTG